MADTRGYFARAAAALSEAEAAPLSVRTALRAATQIDALAERAFFGRAGIPDLPEAEDLIAFRAAVSAACPAIGLVSALCGMAEGAPRLAVKAVFVPLEDTRGMSVAEVMVSVYNAGTVPRVVLAGADGEPEALPVFRTALGWWRARLA
jgi:hypothetical protein